MIVFDLRCGGGHVFEAWFASSAAFEEQRGRRLIDCPVCGDASVEKAVMAPNVAAKGNRAPAPTQPLAPADAAAVQEMLSRIAAAQADALRQSRWVGRDFADTARKMHAGDEAVAPIHGQASRSEVVALVEEGVPVAPLLVPVIPPEQLN